MSALFSIIIIIVIVVIIVTAALWTQVDKIIDSYSHN